MGRKGTLTKALSSNQKPFIGIKMLLMASVSRNKSAHWNSLGLECCSIRIVHPLGTLKAEVVELLLKEYEGTRESWEKLGPEVILTFKL